ncbi:MAG: sugar phosphate isomerase/epimerase [Treponema sp.]|jgi:D-psicose/D-tagatose/L-ribulose 3-epimerase|nr:sugar phosphate isomerase/epimerase [Treponema sp.]
MRYGIYYAYWEKQWGGDYLHYIKKAAGLGFDILELSCAGMKDLPTETIQDLTQAKRDSGVTLTGGYGPRPEDNIASPDPAVVNKALDFWKRTFEVLQKLEITLVGGGLYSYWPVDFSKPFDKGEDLKRSVEGMRKLSPVAAGYGITLGMEALNRFEGYLLNTAAETVEYVKAVGCENVKVMLDTFHMNIEEESFTGAIRCAGSRLGHFHIGEPNRRPPHEGSRFNWREIGETLREIGYTGTVVMEPFVLMGGQVGRDIKVWRDLSDGEGLDRAAAASVAYIRKTFEGN